MHHFLISKINSNLPIFLTFSIKFRLNDLKKLVTEFIFKINFKPKLKNIFLKKIIVKYQNQKFVNLANRKRLKYFEAKYLPFATIKD